MDTLIGLILGIVAILCIFCLLFGFACLASGIVRRAFNSPAAPSTPQLTELQSHMQLIEECEALLADQQAKEQRRRGRRHLPDGPPPAAQGYPQRC